MKTHKTRFNHCLTLVTILANSLAYAAPDAVPAAATSEKTSSAETLENVILSSVVADFNGDKLMDSAILIKSGDRVDFYLFLGDTAGNMKLKMLKKDLVWSGSMAGTLPQLATEKDARLLIYSQNDAIGRNRWHQRLSVDYRDNDFAVTGYIYDERDTLDPKFSLNCDVNLLTGKGIKNKTEFKIEPQKIKLSDWADAKTAKQCKN